jgi:sensor histidine kinase YesM
MHYPWVYMENMSPARQTTTEWTSLGYTVLLCLGIALLLWLLGVTGGLGSTTVVSLCIGLSIHLVFIIAREWMEQYLPAYLAPLPLTAVGLPIGLMLAGTLLFAQPMFFLSDDYGTVILGVFFGIVGAAVIGTRERLVVAQAELAALRVEQEVRQRQLVETELKVLQAQIEPHFLFNTLSNVIGLVHSDPQAAEKTLLNLSTLLRSSLQRTRRESATLAEELEIVRAYLEIQAIRMQQRLRYEIRGAGPESAAALRDWPLPPMLIQPLVENAVRHGIEPAEQGGLVDVSVRLEADGLRVLVADTGVGIDPDGSGSPGTGTGLSNVRSRLRALYGDRANMAVSENEPSGVRVELFIAGPAL